MAAYFALYGRTEFSLELISSTCFRNERNERLMSRNEPQSLIRESAFFRHSELSYLPTRPISVLSSQPSLL